MDFYQSFKFVISITFVTTPLLLDGHSEERPISAHCTASPLRMLLKWPWISHCGDYWQQAELRT